MEMNVIGNQRIITWTEGRNQDYDLIISDNPKPELIFYDLHEIVIDINSGDMCYSIYDVTGDCIQQSKGVLTFTINFKG